MESFREEAEDQLSNFVGLDESDYDGDDEDYDDEEDYVGGSERKAAGIGTINPAARTIALDVANTTAGDIEVSLFGGFKNIGQTNFGNPAGITITSDTIPYGQMLAKSQSNPFKLKGVKLIASGANAAGQLAEKFQLTKTEVNGSTNSYPYFPNLALNPMQTIANMIEDKNFQFIADGESEIKVKIKANSSLKFISFLAANVDLSRVANGKAGVEVTNAATPVGERNVMVVKERGRRRRR
jgi:hypothetical protein